MSEVGESPVLRPYVPFEPFSEWAKSTRVSSLVARYQEKFREMQASPGDDLTALREKATRWAAIDTGAIEDLYEVDRGFTINVAANVSLLQAISDAKGQEVSHAVADALAAYEFVLDLATTRRPVSELAIKELHSVVTQSQETFRVKTAVGWQNQELPKGQYKQTENSPLHLATNEIHSYAPVIETGMEMARYIEELKTGEFASAHAVQQAAYAHYAFVAIHPFSDGNGRVARAIASVFLYRDPGLPFVVFSDEKPVYLAALEAADEGRFQPFVSFVGDRVVDTVNLLESEQGPPLPSIAEQAAAFAQDLSGRGGFAHAEVDAAAQNLLERFTSVLSESAAQGKLSSPLSSSVSMGFMPANIPTPEGFRPAPTNSSVLMLLQSSAPAQAVLQSTTGVFVARGLEGDVDYLLVSSSGQRMEIFLREVLPRVTNGLQMRMQSFADRIFREQLKILTDAARQTLRSAGYS